MELCHGRDTGQDDSDDTYILHMYVMRSSNILGAHNEHTLISFLTLNVHNITSH